MGRNGRLEEALASNDFAVPLAHLRSDSTEAHIIGPVTCTRFREAVASTAC